MYEKNYYLTPDYTNKATVTIRGDMLQYYTENGLYLSGNSPLLSTNRYDFYSTIKSISANFPPFEGIPVKYTLINENEIQFLMPPNLPFGMYDMVFCNPAGYAIASQTKRFNKIILTDFEPLPVESFNQQTLETFEEDPIKTIKKYLDK